MSERTPTGTLNDRLERLAEWIDFGDDFGQRLLAVAGGCALLIAFFAVCGYLSGGGWSFLEALWISAGGK